jgi:uncharacterized membrane protein
MAFSLIFLLLGLWGGDDWAYVVAAIALLLNMIWPPLFTPFAYLWYKLSEILGYISSRLLLSMVFFLVVTPVAWVRRLMGKDTLELKKFKKERGSVLKEKEHTFAAADLEKPF